MQYWMRARKKERTIIASIQTDLSISQCHEQRQRQNQDRRAVPATAVYGLGRSLELCRKVAATQRTAYSELGIPRFFRAESTSLR
jgi:hypothetical protein